MDVQLLEVFRKIIVDNELGGDLAFAYKFSDPDGVRTGKSGWSFGISQFDIANNPAATICLRECEFTTDEILGLKRQDIDMLPMNRKLALSSPIIDKWDGRQLYECLEQSQNICGNSKIRFETDEVLFHLADYHNQFYFSKGGKMHQFLLGIKGPVTPKQVLDFKLGLVWGKKRPDDVRRRYLNIARIYAKEMGRQEES